MIAGTSRRSAKPGGTRALVAPGFFAWMLALQIALSPLPARAGEFEAVCGDVDLSGTGQAGQAQKIQYCQAAKSAQEAAQADSAIWKVWAGVATICTYACVASMTPAAPTSEFLCLGATVTGGVTDAVVTKQFAGALMSIGGAGTGFALNQSLNPDAPTPSPTNKKDIGACIGAAMAGLQVFMKYTSMQSHESAMKSNLEAAQKIAATAPGSGGTPGYQPMPGQGANGAGGGTGGLGSPSGPTYADSSSSIAADTRSTCAAASAGAIMQCAVASDKTLPGFVTDPKFAKEFQKDSGQSLGSFLARNDRPGALMGAAMSNGLTSSQAAKLSSALADLENGAGTVPAPSSIYSGGGAGGGTGGEEPMAGMQEMMAGLMEQLNPNGKQEEKKTGVGAVIFANQTRSPASVAEDRTLNLFDRVTYRYYFVGRRMAPGEAPGPEGERR